MALKSTSLPSARNLRGISAVSSVCPSDSLPMRHTALLHGLLSTNHITLGSQTLCFGVGLSQRRAPAGYGRAERSRGQIKNPLEFPSCSAVILSVALPNSTTPNVQVLSHGYISRVSSHALLLLPLQTQEQQ